MKIFILRHGQAEPYQANDAIRRLTEKGISDTGRILNNNIQALSSVQKIIASPLVRAQQTAAIALDQLKLESVETSIYLEPETNVQDLFSFLMDFTDMNLLLVSHLPLVGILANRLCGYDQTRIQFNTSSLVGIECEIPAANMGKLFLEKHI